MARRSLSEKLARIGAESPLEGSTPIPPTEPDNRVINALIEAFGKVFQRQPPAWLSKILAKEAARVPEDEALSIVIECAKVLNDFIAEYTAEEHPALAPAPVDIPADVAAVDDDDERPPWAVDDYDELPAFGLS